VSASLEVPAARGGLPPDPVAPDSLPFLKRLQTLPARWQGEGFAAFATEARARRAARGAASGVAAVE
jgi:hypothetical protein